MPRRYRPPDPGRHRKRGPGQGRNFGTSVNGNRAEHNAAAPIGQSQTDRLRQNSQGFFLAEVIRRGDPPPGPATWAAVASWLTWRQTAPHCTCVFCDAPLARALPAGFVVITPSPGAGHISGICFLCAALPDAGLLHWAAYLFAARRIDPIHFHDGGRA